MHRNMPYKILRSPQSAFLKSYVKELGESQQMNFATVK